MSGRGQRQAGPEVGEVDAEAGGVGGGRGPGGDAELWGGA